jgi:hypothetical protein
MSSLLDADGFRFACYLGASLISLAAFFSERRVRGPTTGRALLPAFWLMQAVLLATMGVAMAADAAGALTEFGRDRARADSWYLDRGSLQVPLVMAIVATWCATTVIAIWRVPPRRRRYLPSASLVGTLVSFAAVRTVSLHHVDTLLYRTDVVGVRIVAVVEILLLAAVASVTAARACSTDGTSRSLPAEDTTIVAGSAERYSGSPTHRDRSDR